MPVTSFIRTGGYELRRVGHIISPVPDFVNLLVYITREHQNVDSVARLYSLAAIQRRMLMGNEPPGRVFKIFVIVKQAQIVFPFLTG